MPQPLRNLLAIGLLASTALTTGAACDNAQTQQSPDTAATDVPDTACHPFGEPFEPPAGITDPWRLREEIGTYCCSDDAQSIVLQDAPSDGACQRPDAPMFVCLPETGDDVCSPEENFCTSPLDCQPPDNTYPLCCREGVRCSTTPDDETGVDGCCDGLDLRPLSLPDGQGGCLTAPAGGICVDACGDGECTVGENRCNCAADCS